MNSGHLPLASVDEAHASLQVIALEIAGELNEARIALEAFAEHPEDRGALHRFAAHIHLARGALRLAEVYGGALLAEEMEHVARYVDAHSGAGKADADGLDALMRSMEQLPSYVERVASGARDLPLVLLPLLNDLRAVRGSALLSEGTLLLLNLRSDEPARPASAFTGEAAIVELARRLRPRLQLALLGWIRVEHVEQNLDQLADIANEFEQAASAQPLFQLWWVVGALLEALRAGGLEGNVSIKRLLGHVDRELRRLQEQGESRYASSPPVELINNLLYYVARATTSGARVTAVRQSFQLQDVMNAQSTREVDAAETLSAPSVRLMKTVAAAIREDLTRVKDVLDIFVRKGATHVEDLAPQLEMLRKISDTLGVLGLGALRTRVQDELESLKAIVERRIPPDDAALLSIAAALIAVEDTLDSQLLRLILPDAGAAAASPEEPTDEEFRLVQDAVLRECIVNMARIKEAVTQSLSAPAEAQGLDQVPQLVRGITAGLLMLGKQRAVEVMEGVGRALGSIVRPDAGSLAPHRLERLADAVVAVEYYMETLQAGRADQWHMLDGAEARLAELEPASGRVISWRDARAAAERAVDTATAAGALPAPTPAPSEPQATPAAPDHVGAALEQAATPSTPPLEPSTPRARVVPAAATLADPEFVALFVEEARENLTRLNELFPRWVQNPQDTEALRDVRRAFHTLKGSGRMVGAQRLGEFSWSVESLLNRVISQTLPRSPEIVAVVGDAVAAMPQLIDEIDGGETATRDVASIMARADVISGREATPLPDVVAAPAAPVAESAPAVPTAMETRPELSPETHPDMRTVTARADAAAMASAAAELAAAPATAATSGAAVQAQEPAADLPTMDPVLREIFRKETAGHILVVREFIERCARNVAPHPVSEALYRACHTLSGIAKTAGARQGIKVAEPMEHYVRKLYDNGHGLPAEGIVLLQDTMQLLETVSEHVDETTGFFPEQGSLTEGWHALDRALDADLARLASAAERTLAGVWTASADSDAEPEPAAEAPVPPAEPFVAPTRRDEYTEPSLPTLAHELSGADLDDTALNEALAERPAPGLPVAQAPAAPELPVESFEPDVEPVHVDDGDTDFDADIAAIFGEEATELLEQSEAAFSRWRRDRADGSQVTELKRLLHTLKGGARMAGIRAMGDISHELESLLAAVEVGIVHADGEALHVLQESLDELHRMREMANFGQRIPAPVSLLARIRELALQRHGQVEASAAPVLPGAIENIVLGQETGDELAAVDTSAGLHEASLPDLEPTAADQAQPSFGEAAAVDEFAFAQAAHERQAAEEASLAETDVFAAISHGVDVEFVGAGEHLIEALPRHDLDADSAGIAAESAEPQTEFEPVPTATELPPVTQEFTVPPPSWTGAAESQDFGIREYEELPALVQPVELPVFAPAEVAASAVPPVLPGREAVTTAERQELARVDADLLDDLLNNAGEISIFRARIEQQMTQMEFNLAELDRTVTRLREQLRKLEMETEAQILFKHQQDDAHRADFDPLELDRYSTIQQLSRALAESVSDVGSIEGLLENLNRDTQNLLQQQGRIVTEVQNGLMRTRMVPFQRHVQRLSRLLRQAATETGKKAELVVEGASGELDRQVLERMLPPFEHMLRNAVVHGIEAPAERLARGKPEAGTITMRLQREGAEVVIVVEDDGAGLDVSAIRDKARHMGLLRPEQSLTDEEALQLVLEPGFSTADRLTQQAGRGVGMDVVATEVKKLGGGLFIESKPGYGARFTIRLPFTLAITQALIVRVHDEFFALPMATVEGVARLPRSEIERHVTEDQPTFEYGGNIYRFQHLASFLGAAPSVLPETDTPLSVILVRAGEHSTALVADELVGSREIVVKSVGPQIAGIRGISGATILGDGRIVIILDMGTLVRSEWRARPAEGLRATRDDRIFALVVDDSITVRRVTQRLLERNGMRVMTAKDGVEAMALLQDHVPDVILLDIEMPRMDGYEVASHVRNDPRIADVPIIMITSRMGDKHRARAIELGVDDYLGKPYQESQLLDAIEPLVLARRRLN